MSFLRSLGPLGSRTWIRIGLWPQCMCCATHRLLVLNFGGWDRELVSSKDEAQTKFWEQVGGAESRFKTGLIQTSIWTIIYKLQVTWNKYVINIKGQSMHAHTLKHKLKVQLLGKESEMISADDYRIMFDIRYASGSELGVIIQVLSSGTVESWCHGKTF